MADHLSAWRRALDAHARAANDAERLRAIDALPSATATWTIARLRDLVECLRGQPLTLRLPRGAASSGPAAYAVAERVGALLGVVERQRVRRVLRLAAGLHMVEARSAPRHRIRNTKEIPHG